jgi:hypothetical protein
MKKRVRLTESDLHSIIKESVKRIIAEKHRPSGVSRRIHTRDANGNKESFDYIPNLPKYNKYQDFNRASKFQRINARPVEDPNGEDIDTVLKDGTIERKGLHLPQGYYNVNNVGGTEHWGIDPKTFNKKYEADPEQQGVYKPKGGPMMASNPLKRNTSFQAPWGGRMDMKAGSRILQDPNNKKDTYGIGGNEFDSTYKFDESRNSLNKIIKESVKKVLNEGLKGVDPDNVVPQDVAEHYGFRREYAGFKSGLELWGRDIGEEIDAGCTTPRAVSLLRKLGIKRFTTYNYNGKVRITVQPNPKPQPIYRKTGFGPSKNNPWGRFRKTDDYIDDFEE